MGSELDRAKIDEVVQAVCDRLDGEWLLIGGALVALWLEPRRTTEDVDMIGTKGTTAERISLMTVATDLGLPAEIVNSAADFFVHRIADWKSMTVELRRGAKSVVLRPTATLFVLLKIGRLDEKDLGDCLAAVGAARVELDRTRVLAAIDALPPTEDKALATRRARLRASVAGAP